MGNTKTKEVNRRERDDVKRGHGKITEPLTTDEEYELRRLNDFDQWVEFNNNGNKAWRRQEIRAANRRERDDIKRGYWELTEPLTTDEEYELRKQMGRGHY